ncbi:host cell division inhibitor Icd-like protein [Salmonella enterica subsp. enterica serovar Mountpleasant]|nr:host cell division inhibitor Icd-like protein [Salmonella enterica subsp. enterica serovar Mountpleasant]
MATRVHACAFPETGHTNQHSTPIQRSNHQQRYHRVIPYVCAASAPAAPPPPPLTPVSTPAPAPARQLFIWRFWSSRNVTYTTTATSEQEARLQLPAVRMVFVARIRKEV